VNTNVLVVGEKEQETESVTMRNRDNEDQKGQDEGSISLQDAVDKLVSLQKSRAPVAKFD
jgi:threonyl-tRNA synthetase